MTFEIAGDIIGIVIGLGAFISFILVAIWMFNNIGPYDN